jgi:hypothetical protein
VSKLTSEELIKMVKYKIRLVVGGFLFAVGVLLTTFSIIGFQAATTSLEHLFLIIGICLGAMLLGLGLLDLIQGLQQRHRTNEALEQKA